MMPGAMPDAMRFALPNAMHERTDGRNRRTIPLPLRRYRSLSDARTENRSEEVVGWPISGLTCQHGNASGACSECRNGVDPTTGDVA